MLKGGHDQAAGLRRLFAPRQIPVIAVVGGQAGIGATHIACALAVHLASRRVAITLIDEHRGPRSATTVLGAQVRYDLAQAVQGDVRSDQAVATVADRLQLVSAARLADAGEIAQAGRSSRVTECWNRLVRSSDVVIIDARLNESGRLSSLAAKADTVAVVATAGSAGVMGSYLRLKAIAQEHRQVRVGLIVNRTESQVQAASIHENMDGLARKQCGRGLEFFGALSVVPAWRADRPGDSESSQVRSLAQILLPTLAEQAFSPVSEARQHAGGSSPGLASTAAFAV